MRKKQTKKIVNRVDKMVDFSRQVVDIILKENGLSDYKVKVVYHDDPTGEKSNVMAEINVDYDYMRATIFLYPCYAEYHRQGNYRLLIEALCHEAFHIKLSRIDNLANSRWGTPEAVRSEIERLTEIYGRMMFKSMNLEHKFDKFLNNGKK